MKYALIFFGCAFLYRLITNLSSLIRLNYYSKQYLLYLADPAREFEENAVAVAKLFRASGLTDRMIHFVQPMGYGQLLQGQAYLFSNMENRREDVVDNMRTCFSSARGSFKNRIIENFSPIFWINCILFLPRTVLSYLGVSGESLLTKLFQVIYWIVTPVLVLLRDNIYQYILSLFK